MSTGGPTSCHVEVALRVRPLLPSEQSRGETAAVTISAPEASTAPTPHDVEGLHQQGQPPPSLPFRPTVRVVRAPTAGKDAAGQRRRAPPTGVCTFTFDYALGPESTQREVFHALDVASFCDDALAGKAVTIFCFGQTGSGKTYTLSGPALQRVDNAVNDDADGNGTVAASTVEDGLQFQAVRYLAAQVERRRHPPKAPAQPSPLPPPSTPSEAPTPKSTGASRRKASTTSSANQTTRRPLPAPAPASSTSIPPPSAPQVSVMLRASYLELYNEHLYDLLQEGKGGLRCRWSAAANSFFVEESLVVECDGAGDLLLVLREGHAYRHRASHRLNADSSRSHGIFTIFIETAPVRAEGDVSGGVSTAPTRHGKLTFVDLAGSERLKETGSPGEDTKAINRSLFALGNVIEKLSALSESKSDRATSVAAAAAEDGRKGTAAADTYIPYRSSILTQLLMDSLNGGSRTLMITCVSPSSRFVEESLRAIHYAQRARHIATAPAERVDAEEQHRVESEKAVQRLRRENRLLRAALGIPLVHARVPGDAVCDTERDTELTAETIQGYVRALMASAQGRSSDWLGPAAAKSMPQPTRSVVTPPAGPPLRRQRLTGASVPPGRAGTSESQRPSLPPLPSIPPAESQRRFSAAHSAQAKDRQVPAASGNAVSSSTSSSEVAVDEEACEDLAKGDEEDAVNAFSPCYPPMPLPPPPLPATSALDLLSQLPDTVERRRRKTK